MAPSTGTSMGCWGPSRAAAGRLLPAPPTDDKERPQHQRRRSFSWFSSSRRGAEEQGAPSPADQDGPLADASAALAEALFDLELEDQRPSDKAAMPRKGDKPAGAALHRRRWSFGRQVAPQPSEEAGPSGEAALGELAGSPDDLLATASDISFSSARGSPAAAAAAAARLQRASGDLARSSPQQAGAAPAVATPQRTGGYRRLWHSITSVRKGDPLPAGGAGLKGQEVTVESLVKSVQRLKAGQPVMEAVREGLAHLDSRAVAALLKELSKGGLPHRAAELFDWLRSLPRDHELAHLADLYTYTTIISQCGGHQQLRRALELVAEMRSRGIEANIHTYSALMSVCVKCNECELALDVYQQLLAEGCAPNLVTYNVLIDIHGKSGQWARAMEVLDTLKAQGLTAEARTYNTVISACSKAGQPSAALRVYERMLADGVQPTQTTYTSLISAHGKAGQVEEALRIYQDMAARGCERNVITYSSLISACERAGRCDIALRLWEEMRREGCRPNVVTYNGLLGACAQAGMWAKAAEVFEAMVASGCRPDAVTYSVLIAAYERGGQWRRCLQAFEKMQQQGFRPDACVYNAVLDALVASGLVAAQVKAVQLYAAAHRAGHLRLAALSPSEWSATAHTYGAAFVTLLRWLAELREAPPAAAMPLAFAAAGAAAAASLGQPLQPVGLLLTRGKHCRTDQSYGPIQAALARCFEAFSAPLAAKPSGQGLSIQGDALALTAWLASPSAAALLSPLDAAGGGGSVLLSASLLADDVAADMQCSKAFAAVLEFEAGHAVSGDALAGSPRAAALRQQLASDVVALSHSLGIAEETALDAVQLADRVMGAGVAMEAGLAPLYAAAMLLLCCRQSGEAAQLLSNAAALAQLVGLPLSTVLEAEAHLSGALGGDTSAVSALRVLQLYLERLGCNLLALQKCQLLELMAVAALNLARKAVLSPAFVRFRPSVVAAACLLKARQGLGMAPAWPRALQSMTAYLPAPDSQLGQCLELMTLLGMA